MRGKLIVIESIDGGGGSTQAKLLTSELNDSGRKTVYEAQPSRLPTGKLLREFLEEPPDAHTELTMGLLFAADRHEHQTKVIAPFLESGTNIVLDRYIMSSRAYQENVSLNMFSEMEKGLIRADLTVFLDVTPEEALRRRKLSRRATEERYDQLHRQKTISNRYKDCVKDWERSDRPVVVVEGNKSLTVIADTICNHVVRQLF